MSGVKVTAVCQGGKGIHINSGSFKSVFLLVLCLYSLNVKCESCSLTPLLGNEILKFFSHVCNICNTYLEKAVTALERVISQYPTS